MQNHIPAIIIKIFSRVKITALGEDFLICLKRKNSVIMTAHEETVIV